MTEAGFITPPDLPLPQGEGVKRGCRRWRLYAGNKGVTLVELLVVISVIGVLSVSLGFFYAGWQGAYKVESATREIYSDMLDARARAMQFNRSYFINFPSATTYRMVEDTNDNTAMNIGAGDTVLQTFPKTVEYPLVFSSATFTFDKRGIITPPGTVQLTTTNNADYDCITVANTRIKTGKWTGGACVEK